MFRSAEGIRRLAIGDIIQRNARRYPDRIAIVDGEKHISFSEMENICNQFAHFLLEQGLKKGDRVACVCQNSAEFLFVMYGIAKAGLVWVPITPVLAPADIEYIIDHSDARALVVDDVLYPHVAALLPSLSQVETVVTIPLSGADLPGSTLSFPNAITGHPVHEPDADIHSDDLISIMYTSGTTGRPKGVMHDHVSVYVAALGNIIEGEMTKDDVVTCMLPLFHCAQHVVTMSALAVGAASVVLRGFDPTAFFTAVDKEKISWMVGLPIMYKTMLDHPEAGNYDLSSLRYCLYAMAAMDEGTLRRAIDRFGARFALGTGQTEVYPSTMYFKPEEQLRRFGPYWGISSLTVDTALMDDEGNLLSQGQIGEIVHQGPNVMKGYWKNEQATEQVQTFGWHHTGDLGVFDPDGQLIFIGRKKDMIKTGGENVPAGKVENVILNDSRVANAAVVGLPHEHWGEAVTAFVIPKPGTLLTGEEIINGCKKELAGFEIPKAVVILNQFPMTATGKIQKHVLKETYVKYYAAMET
ncbi:AMP-binding protein [Aneurinibacillus tyrosinisolvens]|uniref:AMP-binding protein n=1 Tax=Aneurinibacillus tyrosinisolvens TaxID=1443435 RepID=UPI00063FCC1B|nr:AMP-binding protein [Aneurinibacillus tyrosinisolvens]